MSDYSGKTRLCAAALMARTGIGQESVRNQVSEEERSSSSKASKS